MNYDALQQAIGKYTNEFKEEYQNALRGGQATPELSYRNAIHNFFRDLTVLYAPDAHITYEPSSQSKKGHPDWRFHDRRSFGVYGYAESKGFEPNNDLDWKRHRVQIRKYLSLGHKLMFTDGMDFFLFNPRRSEPTRLSLVKKPLKINSEWMLAAPLSKVWHFFSKFFQKPEPRCVSDKHLIEDLAIRAKYFAEEIDLLAKLSPDEGKNSDERDAIAVLGSIKETLASKYDTLLLKHEMFSKAVSQIMMFGAFYAHRHAYVHANDEDLHDRIKSFWTGKITDDGENRLKPFRAMAVMLNENNRALHGISFWYLDYIQYLSYVRLSVSQQEEPDYHELYEAFLDKFDPRDKVDFGAYATHRNIARFMLVFADHISCTTFKKSVFMRGNKIIDPCCGTGTFLEEIVKEAARQNVNADIFPVVAGFEILAAPYALSQYRLYQLRVRFPLASSVKTLLCDTLSDKVIDSETVRDTLTGQNTLLDDEILEAAEMATPPITLVIGNPPSSDAGMHLNDRGIIGRMLEDFRPSRENRTTRQNIQKQVQNDFMKFLRWGCYKVDHDGQGIIACILPSSFLQSKSYVFARKWIFRNFSNVWVIELDKDARTGTRTSNVFRTLQGRCMMFCTKTTGEQEKTIRYASITDKTRTEKLAWFSSMSASIQQGGEISNIFSRVTPSDNYSFKPAAQYNAQQYDTFWNLIQCNSNSGIFERHVSGVKLGMTAALTHLDRGQLSRRTRDIADLDMTYTDLRENWFKGQAKPPPERNLSGEIRGLIRKASADMGENIKRYSFRPFINAYVLLHEETLQKAGRSGGGGARYRPELLASFSQNANPGIAIAPSPVDLSDKLQRFASFFWNLPDNELCTRGNARVFCATFPEHKPVGKGKWDNANRNNISPSLENALRSEGIDSDTVGMDVVFYVYAILSSDAYLDTFEGVLYSNSIRPKIPIFKNPTFDRLASLGKAIAKCEEETRPDPMRACDALPKNGLQLKECEFDLLTGTITLLDYNSKRYTISGFDGACLQHSISGYGVFKEYIKRCKWPYLNRFFTNDDVLKLYSLNDALLKQFRLIDRVNHLIKSALDKHELITPPE